MAKSLLIFGGGFLQLSLIEKCKEMGIRSIVIDPFEGAPGKQTADHFEVVGGQDFEGTCAMVEKYQIDGIITSATDKPLVMMARVAEHFNLPFYSVKTAEQCTDKHQMKAVFQSNDISHAEGYLIQSETDIQSFPAIIKPLDNSGSRGVYFCENKEQAASLVTSSFQHTKDRFLLAETFISGSEYSVESLHYKGRSEVIQITEKYTTPFPTNVEVAHIAPAQLSEQIKDEIRSLIDKIHHAFQFNNCAAHTELKIENGQITVIETSPRLGGDFISSDLAPLSTGINMEKALISIALGEIPQIPAYKMQFAGAFFFLLESGKRIKKIPTLDELNVKGSLQKIALTVRENETIGTVESSLDRHGYFILRAPDRATLQLDRNGIHKEVRERIEYF